MNPTEHVYLEDIEHRRGWHPRHRRADPGGSRLPVERAVGAEAIRRREESSTHRAMHRWEENLAIEILGSRDLPRLSIVSFVVRHEGRYLHHTLVVAVLK